MLYTVLFENKPPRYFDTDKFTASEPFNKEGNENRAAIHLLTEYDLRLDMLTEHGLVLEISWYDARLDTDTPKSYSEETECEVYHAVRRPGRFVCLVEQTEAADVAKIFRDKELIAWRVGEDIVDGIKFAAQELLCFSDKNTASINKRAVLIFDYLQKANPSAAPDEVAAMLGYSLNALEIVRTTEELNQPALDPPDEDMLEEWG